MAKKAKKEQKTLELFKCAARDDNRKDCKKCQFSKWFLQRDMKRQSCPMTKAIFFVESKVLNKA